MKYVNFSRFFCQGIEIRYVDEFGNSSVPVGEIPNQRPCCAPLILVWLFQKIEMFGNGFPSGWCSCLTCHRLLKQCRSDPKYGHQMSLILNLLLAICGKAMRQRFEGQEALMDDLTGIAERLKYTKESLRLVCEWHFFVAAGNRSFSWSILFSSTCSNPSFGSWNASIMRYRTSPLVFHWIQAWKSMALKSRWCVVLFYN